MAEWKPTIMHRPYDSVLLEMRRVFNDYTEKHDVRFDLSLLPMLRLGAGVFRDFKDALTELEDSGGIGKCTYVGFKRDHYCFKGQPAFVDDGAPWWSITAEVMSHG